MCDAAGEVGHITRRETNTILWDPRHSLASLATKIADVNALSLFFRTGLCARARDAAGKYALPETKEIGGGRDIWI